jgi:hypothetical protein
VHVRHGPALGRGAAAVGVLDVDAGARQAARDVRERAGPIGHVDGQDLGGERQHTSIAEEMERFLRLVDDEADHRVIDEVRDREGADADAMAPQVGREVGEYAGPIVEERRELRLHPHHHLPLDLRTGRGAGLQGEACSSALPESRSPGTQERVFLMRFQRVPCRSRRSEGRGGTR